MSTLIAKLNRGVHIFLPVIHMNGIEQVVRNAKVAADNGADGVFLIHHSRSYPTLLGGYERVREILPELWVGLNCLDLGAGAIDTLPRRLWKDLQGYWADYAGIDDNGPTKIAHRFQQKRSEIGWKGLYFGGVAHKGLGQNEAHDPALAAKFATPYVDVITTSGKGTGEPPSVDKIIDMRNGSGGYPLVIASGMDSENVEDFMPYSDGFLVASSISQPGTDEFDEGEVRALAKKLGK